MRFFIINTDYPRFTRSLYEANPGLARASYAKQMEVRHASLFGTSDFYPKRLAEIGHEAMEVHGNNLTLQMAWAREHGCKRLYRYGVRLPLRPLAWRWERAGMEAIVLEQVRQFKPDVILTHDLEFGRRSFYEKLKQHAKLLVLQIACPLDWRRDFGVFDLVVTSLPSYVARFESLGVPARLFRLGFDPVVLEQVPEAARDIDVSFVGSISRSHPARLAWLETLCRALPVKVWGEGVELLPAASAVRKAHQGSAWGREMYNVMRRSKVTLNYHIDIAGDDANNMRLYESTGCGACLVTDRKRNMADMFEPGKEVVLYESSEDCVVQVKRLLSDDQRRQAIASAGQARTLCEHTYKQRMAQLVDIARENTGVKFD